MANEKYITIAVLQNGVVLDDIVVSASEWREELKRYPYGLLAMLGPGESALTPDQEA